MNTDSTISRCARCKQPGILHTVAGEGAWDAERGEFRASYVAPAFPEDCEPWRWGKLCNGFCASGTCKSPEDAVSRWREMNSK